MDWDNDTPFSLNRASAIRNAPEASGLYGLRNDRRWIYIGGSPNIRRALLEYLSGHMPYVLQSQPNVFVFEPCPPNERTKRQRELAQRYKPVCNKKRLLMTAE